jgi:hypothetical protein
VLGLVFFAGIVPAGVRGADEAYFSISTSKTFLPGEQIGVRLYASGVDALEFRVYKVNDPVAFFERLDDPHQFGHVSETEEIEAASWIERFYDWKQDLWDEIRDFFRMQFSWRSRAKIRDEEVRASGTKFGSAAVFAQAPLLNSSQLVARWRQALPPRFISETQTVPVSTLAKGVYLVEATDGTLRAYTIVIVSDLGVITKTAPGQVLAFAADRQSGAPVAAADVRVWTDKKEDARLQTDSRRLGRNHACRKRNTTTSASWPCMETTLPWSMPYSYNLSSDPTQDWTGYVYTDRPVYRPGDTTHFKTILRLRSGEEYKVPAGSKRASADSRTRTSKPVLQTNYLVSSIRHAARRSRAAGKLPRSAITRSRSAAAGGAQLSHLRRILRGGLQEARVQRKGHAIGAARPPRRQRLRPRSKRIITTANRSRAPLLPTTCILRRTIRRSWNEYADDDSDADAAQIRHRR